MLKSFFPNFDWDHIKAVGFDLDGTLYPEEEFISQAYFSISELFSTSLKMESRLIYSLLMKRWREMGSSYPFLFREVLSSSDLKEEAIQEEIKKALGIFRKFNPKLILDTQIKKLLDATQNYERFLVTDGQSQLQRSKIQSLGLTDWFSQDKIAISGDFGSHAQKPSIQMLSHLKLETQDPSQIVYFGDRDRDAQFAKNAGFQFILFSLKLDDSGSRIPPIIQLPSELEHTPKSQTESSRAFPNEKN